MKKALIVSCFDWYKARLEPIRQVLLDKGYDVTVIESDFDHIKKTLISKRYPECTYISVPQYKKNLSFQRINSHLTFGKKIGKLVYETKPDIIYLQMPPNNIARYCKKYKVTNPDTRLILDIVDLWPESMPLGKVKKTLPATIWRKWRNDAINVADYVFTECDYYREVLHGVVDENASSTLYLFKDQSIIEKEVVRKSIDITSEKQTVKFAYLGSMNNIIDIEGIRRVICAFLNNGYICELHAIGDGESRELFEKTIKSLGCKVCFYGVVYDELEKTRLLSPCDYALNMMKDSVSVGLTLKSIDYMSYGLPLINNIKGDTWRIVETEKIGINIDDGIDNNTLCSTVFDRDAVLYVFKKYFSKKAFSSKVKEVFYERVCSNGCV